jgi:hypothetical protein
MIGILFAISYLTIGWATFVLGRVLGLADDKDDSFFAWCIFGWVILVPIITGGVLFLAMENATERLISKLSHTGQQKK